jgi:hypothetical protein
MAEPLSIYLNDHYGGSAAAVARCRHARDQTDAEELARFFDELGHEIEEDRATLLRVMDRVGVRPSTLKPAAGLVLERIARLKPSGGFALARLVDLEALALGVEGKRLLWVVLGALADPRLAEFDFTRFEERAGSQRERIEEHRLRLGLEALR